MRNNIVGADHYIDMPDLVSQSQLDETDENPFTDPPSAPCHVNNDILYPWDSFARFIAEDESAHADNVLIFIESSDQMSLVTKERPQRMSRDS